MNKKPYRCHYCGRATSMMAYVYKTEKALRWYPSCCDKPECVGKWKSRPMKVDEKAPEAVLWLK